MRRRPALAPAFAALALLAAAGCSSEDTGGALDTEGGTAPLRPGATTLPPGATVLTADLAGAEEVPGPGAAGGAGMARLVFTADGRVCADLTTTKVDLPTAAHVHSGARGVAGPVVITLPTPNDGTATGCVNADAAAAAKVTADPTAFYVNVHTATLPNGAVRGQLTK